FREPCSYQATRRWGDPPLRRVYLGAASPPTIRLLAQLFPRKSVCRTAATLVCPRDWIEPASSTVWIRPIRSPSTRIGGVTSTWPCRTEFVSAFPALASCEH